jgi:hypothetical protein
MQSINNNMNNNNEFKLVGKKSKNVESVAVAVADKKPVITCDFCQKLWHKKDKCFLFIKEQKQIKKLRTTECSYCHALGHTNFNCPVSQANAEKKAQKQKENAAKFEADFPKALSTEPKQQDNSGSVLKFSWASVAMANRDPVKLQKIEEENTLFKEAEKLSKKEMAEQLKREKEQRKLAAAEKKWYKIRPVILELKVAFPRTWFWKVENTPYDISEASELRDEEDEKREKWEAEQEQLDWEENERNNKESKEREAKRDKMTPEELEKEYRDAEEDYENAMMYEENIMFSRMFAEQWRPRRQCVSCVEWIEKDNQGTMCLDCIFQLGPYPVKNKK